MFNDKYIEWNQKRIKAIIDFYGYQFFFQKKLLDLGCGHADISGALYRLGSDITAVDARQNHLQMVKKKFPQIKTVQADLDAVWPFYGKSFDILLHLGLLCHLDNYEEQLKRACASTSHLILETTVCDSDDPYKCIKVSENKAQYDMSFNGVGSRPSAAAIERVLTENGMTFRRLDNAKLNSGTYVYDWYPQNNGECNFQKRRIWFCSKTNTPPPNTIKDIPLTPGKIGFVPTSLQDSNVHIAHRSLVLTKSPSVPHEQKVVNAPPPPAPHKPEGQKIRLFVNYYEDSNIIRKNELDNCLMSNINNKEFDVVVIHSDQPPTFSYLFEKVNLIVGDDDISIISNADIYFDNSIIIAKGMGPRDIYALSRWEVTGSNSFKIPNKDNSPQNVWIVRGKIKGVDGDFSMGKPGSDGRIAYQFEKGGYQVSNPALSIKAFHLHHSGVRHYSETDRIDGPYLSLPVVGL